MSAVGSPATLGAQELMCASAPLLGNVDDGGPTVRDLRAMARMLHTGVPLADVAFIFGMSPARTYWCVWRYAWMWRLGVDLAGGDPSVPDGDALEPVLPCSMR